MSYWPTNQVYKVGMFSSLCHPPLCRMWTPTHGPRPKTWLVSGICCSSPSRTSASSSMSSTTLNPTTGSTCHSQLPSHPLSGRYFPPLLPSALAGVGKPPTPASLLPPPPPLLPLFFTLRLPPLVPAWDELLTGPPCQNKGAREIPLGMHGDIYLKEGWRWFVWGVCVCMYVKPCFEHACVPNCRVLQLSMANVHRPVWKNAVLLLLLLFFNASAFVFCLFSVSLSINVLETSHVQLTLDSFCALTFTQCSRQSM